MPNHCVNSPKGTAELSPELKKRLQLLDRIKANEENLWENIGVHYSYVVGFTMHILVFDIYRNVKRYSVRQPFQANDNGKARGCSQ